MDNQAMFDFNGHPLESLKVFNYVKTGTYVTDKKVACTVVKDVEFESEDAELRTNESQSIKYKRSWHDEYLKWVCGFANAKGGTI